MFASLFSTLSSKIILGAVIVIVLMITGFTIYYNHTQNKIDKLNKSIGILETSNKIQEETIKKIKNQLDTAKKANDNLNKKYNDIEKETSEAVKAVTNQDLNDLLKKDAKATEKKINDNMRDIFSNFEKISANKQKEEENVQENHIVIDAINEFGWVFHNKRFEC